jgi:hypothetical protein
MTLCGQSFVAFDRYCYVVTALPHKSLSLITELRLRHVSWHGEHFLI